MYEKDKPEKKKLASIYHDLDGLAGYVECIREMSDDVDLNYNLKQIKQKLEQTQAQMIEAVVKDVMGAYRPIQKTVQTADISLEQAVALIKIVEKQAKHMDLSVVVAICSSAARPIAIHCMDDAFIASFDVAVNKAFTSAALKMATSVLKNLSQPGQELYGVQHTNEGKIVIFGGGEPLLCEKKLIGAVGVSGGTEEQDTFLAEFAKNKLKEVVMW